MDVPASSPVPAPPPLLTAPGSLHELRAPPGAACHARFAIMLLSQLPGSAPILWIAGAGAAGCGIYPPGLAWLGLDPARMVFAAGRDDAECLGNLEVALRGGMSGVAEAGGLTRLAAKRLALAAKRGGGVGFLLRHAPAVTPLDSTAPASRWFISPAAGAGHPRLRAERLYAKGAEPGVFFYDMMEAQDAAPALALVAEAAAPARWRAAG